MSAEIRRTLLGCLLALIAPVCAADSDVFRTERQVNAVADGALDSNAQFCVSPNLDDTLTLLDAVAFALCNNNQTRQAWARIKYQAAAVGVATAAYLPRLDGSLQEMREQSSAAIEGHPDLGSNYRSVVTTGGATLSWVLFDFGGREANLRNATSLLAAAQADRDASLQTVFATVVKDYCAAQAEQGVVVASAEIEHVARESFKVASARVDRGVSPISDVLQAQTALAEATLNLAKAQGDRQAALGVLASDLNLRPDATFRLPPVEEGVQADTSFDESISELITRTEREHPTVLAASAQLRAAEAKVDQTRAEGAPSLSLVAKLSHSNQPVIPVARAAPAIRRRTGLVAWHPDHGAAFRGFCARLPTAPGRVRRWTCSALHWIKRGTKPALMCGRATQRCKRRLKWS